MPAVIVSKHMEIPDRQSLVARTADVLRRHLEALPDGELLPGERRLAEKLEVSRKTLRAALKLLQKEGLFQTRGNRRRVVTGRRNHGRPAGDNREVALLLPMSLSILPSAGGIYWIDHLRESLAKRGYGLRVLPEPKCYSQNPRKALEDLLKREHPSGWVLVRSTFAMQQWFAERVLPVMVAGSRHPGVYLPSVALDLQAVGRHAAGLFAGRGHRCAAMLTGKPVAAGDEQTRTGFMEGCKTADSPMKFVDAQHNGTVEGLCLKLDTLLAGKTPPTAFFTTFTGNTLTVLTHFLRRGLRIPRDAAILSRDSNRYLEQAVPSVARYELSPHTYAHAVNRIVLDLTTGGNPAPKEHLLFPDFIPGDTLG